MEAIFLVIGVVVGAAAAWLLLQRRSARLEAELGSERERRSGLEHDAVRLTTELELERRSAASEAVERVPDRGHGSWGGLGGL